MAERHRAAVVLSPGQFEPWQTRTHELLSYSPQSAPYARAAQIFDGVTRGDIPDPTNGATHFLNPEIVRMRRAWQFAGLGERRRAAHWRACFLWRQAVQTKSKQF